MAEIIVDGRMHVERLKKQFKDEFMLSLRVFDGSGNMADDKATLASLRKQEAKEKGGELKMFKSLYVRSLVHRFQKMFGIKIQIANLGDTDLVDDNVSLYNAARGIVPEKRAKAKETTEEAEFNIFECFKGLNLEDIYHFEDEDDSGLYGFMETETEKVVVKPIFSYIEYLDENNVEYFIWVDDGNAYHILYKDGTVSEKITPECRDEFDEDGYARAESGGKWGVIEKPGYVVVVPFKYAEKTDIGYSDDYENICSMWCIRVKLDGKWGLLSGSGEEILPCIYDHVSQLGEYDEIYLQLNGKWGFGFIKNDKLNLTVPHKYDKMMWGGDNGRLEVTLDGEKFFINYDDERI